MSYKGKFKPKFPTKYRGNLDNITWRSSWEFKVMKYLDETPGVLEWASEEIVIPYISPLDNKYHRYFVDFYAKIKNNKGLVENILIEVKPFKETLPPKPRKQRTAKYLKEETTYLVNQAKWAAARHYAENNGWKFYVMTEKELGLTKHK